MVALGFAWGPKICGLKSYGTLSKVVAQPFSDGTLPGWDMHWIWGWPVIFMLSMVMDSDWAVPVR